MQVSSDFVYNGDYLITSHEERDDESPILKVKKKHHTGTHLEKPRSLQKSDDQKDHKSVKRIHFSV